MINRTAGSHPIPNFASNLSLFRMYESFAGGGVDMASSVALPLLKFPHVVPLSVGSVWEEVLLLLIINFKPGTGHLRLAEYSLYHK